MASLFNHVLKATSAIALITTNIHASPLYTLELLPQSSHIISPIGTVNGWGYRITNNYDHYLIPTSINADIIDDGFLIPLFDFPVIAPNSVVEQPYIAGKAGLFEFTWDANATPNSVNSGFFSITADFFSNDPLAGGRYEMWAGETTANYWVSAIPLQAIPEPPVIVLLTPLLLMIIWQKKIARDNGRHR